MISIVFYFRPNSKTDSESFLIKRMKHTVKGCEVCYKQIKPATLKDESGSCKDISIPQDKILKKINLPEVAHYGVTCQSSQTSPIIGNVFRCFTCKDFISCESCYDSMKHEHSLLYVSSKLNLLFEKVSIIKDFKIIFRSFTSSYKTKSQTSRKGKETPRKL